MALQTDLSRSPYYDDYNADKNFYRVLYRPGIALQTREINQMQTILQDQIDKFGRHIFTEGSVVEGCSFTFDKSYDYVKINDNYANGSAFTIADFVGNYVYNSNGLEAVITNAVTGFQSQAPDLNTLYIKYRNTGTFPNSSSQSSFANGENLVVATLANVAIGNVTVATVANSTGLGYAFTTTSGVIFQKGFFVNVKPQTLIVNKYTNQPNNISVGFNSVENIVTPEADTSLLDNAAGAPNYSAPGAHRLQLVPTLITRETTQIANNDSFFSLVDFKDGVPVTIRNTPEYNALNKELARRSYETNGNYIVNPFLLSTEPKASDDPLYANNVNLVSSRGIGYVEGYRVEFVNNNKISLRKGVDTETVVGQIVSANFGNYVYVNEYAGDFDTENVAQVELHNVAKTAVSSGGFLSVGYSSSTKIGTAYVKAFAYDDGTIGSGEDTYRLYLFNIDMIKGESFSNVRSIIRYSSTVRAVGDVVLTYNAALSANIASIQEPKLNSMIYPMGQRAIKSDGFDNIEYVYRNKATAQFQTTGSIGVGLPTVVGTGTETYNYSGVLSANEAESFVVIPSATVASTNKTGTVAATNGANVVTGTSTTFTTEYRVGDHIKINNEVHYITAIANSTSLTVRENFASSPAANTHSKLFVSGVPIDFTQPSRTITIAGSTATFNLGETLATTMQTSVYHDIKRINTVAIQKNIIKNAFVKIDCSTHSANSVGPWSLGLPDVNKINAIYIGTGGVYSNTGADSSSAFTLYNGQTDNSYDLAVLKLKPLSLGLIDNNSTILVDLDVFTQDRSQGVGFFTANSYPIDDANTSNTSAITTQSIPQYTSSASIVYDLRDCIDFRPYSANTADVTQTYTTATVNPSNANVIDILPAGSFIPTYDSNWQADVTHYLPRKDIAVITTKGRLQIIEGDSNINPKAPANKAGTMTLGVITVPPYPSLSTKEARAASRYDYAISTTITQNKRYTMSDIGALATRIDNLEYYTSLNLLEQATSSLLVKNSTTGLNRFKNGILVDPFSGHDIADTLDPSYNISIDPAKKELRPYFYQRNERFVLDSVASTGVRQVGPLIMLDYVETPYVAQIYANKYRNCIEGNIYVYKSDIILKPNYQASPDLKTNPDVVNNFDLSQNFINIKNAWGTQWGNWQTVADTTTSSVGAKTETSSTTDSVGNVIKSFNQKTTTTTSTTQQQTGTQLSIAGNNDQSFNLGTFVQDISIQPYIKSSQIAFSTSGMRPGARVYAYFNNVAVSDWCIPLDSTWTPTGTFGDPLIVNSNGTVYGQFTIPPNTFQATELTFMLCDVDNLTTGSASITTQASGIFYASNLSVTKGSSILNTRVPILDVQQVTNEQTITNSSTGDTSTVEVTPGPSINQPTGLGPLIPWNNGITPGPIISPNPTPPTDGGDSGNFGNGWESPSWDGPEHGDFSSASYDGAEDSEGDEGDDGDDE
jgi:hypothetical protein